MSLRLSVSAVRTYHTCPAQYYYAKVLRLPQPPSPYAVFGTITHVSYYHAYAFPEQNGDEVLWRTTGHFEPKLALEVFDLLAHRRTEDLPLDPHQEILFGLTEPTDQFTLTKGRTKRMESREGWVAHYREMLENALANPLDPQRVLAVEKRIEYRMGDVDFLGFVDLFYEHNGLVVVDLKTEYNKPSSNELTFNDQIARYYKATGADNFWYYHLRSGEIFEVPKNEELIRALEVMDTQVAQVITSDLPEHVRFPRRFGEQCHYCAYRKECWGIEPQQVEYLAR